MNYDLTIYANETDHSGLLMAGVSPKQSARGRQDDLLIAFLKPGEQNQIQKSELSSQLEAHTKAFFKTSGSVTKAIKVFIDGLNRYFVEKNDLLDEPQTWQTAALVLSVLHYDTLFVAQLGAAQTRLISDADSHLFYDEDLDLRGLGAATISRPSYFQSPLKGGEFLLFTAVLDETSIELKDLSSLTKAIQRLPKAEQDWGLVKVDPGTGKIKNLPLEEFALLSSQAETTSQTDQSAETDGSSLEEDGLTTEDESMPEEQAHEPSLAENLFGQTVLYPQDQEDESTTEDPVAETTQQIQPGSTQEVVKEPAVQEKQPPVQPAPQNQKGEESQLLVDKLGLEKPDLGQVKDKALHGIAAGAGWLRSAEEKAEAIVSTAGSAEEGKTGYVKELSPWAKALIAIVVPLVIVLVTALVFFNRGEDHEYAYYLAQAQASISNAAQMQTVELQREGWEQALVWLDQAAVYENTTEVKELRARAQSALDELDGAKRLKYVAAYAPTLYPALDISAIVSLNNDLYLLDRATGTVKYLRLRNTGYEMDPEFTCGPGTYDGVQVGELVDMISIPLNNPAKAPVMAVDANANLLYCSPNAAPVASHLATPDVGWASLKTINFDSNRLFVLDPGNQALWLYRGFTSNFNSAPVDYFDEPIVDLTTAVDMEVEGEELFLLHSDGRSSHCLASLISGVITCDDPYPYANDGSSGFEVDFSSLKFEQIAYSPPPDPSIFYLEPSKAELYQFSLRLNLNRVIRSGLENGALPQQKVSSFYVSPDRRVFLAFGSVLYYAVLP